jgi:hypothetical protein
VLDVRAEWRRLRGRPKQTKTFECTAFGPFKPLNFHVASLSTIEQSKAMGAAVKALFNPSAADVERHYFEATHPFKVHHWHHDERVGTLTCCWCGRAGLTADITPEQINQGERFGEREASGRLNHFLTIDFILDSAAVPLDKHRTLADASRGAEHTFPRRGSATTGRVDDFAHNRPTDTNGEHVEHTERRAPGTAAHSHERRECDVCRVRS